MRGAGCAQAQLLPIQLLMECQWCQDHAARPSLSTLVQQLGAVLDSAWRAACGAAAAAQPDWCLHVWHCGRRAGMLRQCPACCRSLLAKRRSKHPLHVISTSTC